MRNLDEILDEVRAKYYCSKIMNRPTISWSKDYITAHYGEYTFYNNHITISRTLDDDRVSKEMLASVVYHESLHQEIEEHDEFHRQEHLFPNFDECGRMLGEFMSIKASEIVYPHNYNSFTEGKKQMIFILLPGLEDYEHRFYFMDNKNTCGF